MVDNSKHLIKFQKEELERKGKAVKDAVQYLLHNNEKISINRIAQKAQVSRTFIYNNSELKEMVAGAKPASIARAERHRIESGQARSLESKNLMIQNLKKRIKDLEVEMTTIKKQNENLRAYIASIEE